MFAIQLLRFSKTLIMFSVLLALAGCSAPGIDSYKDNLPSLSVRTFFDGELHAHGIVKNRSGKVIRYFNATILASWDTRGVGTLDEQFVFDDGEKQRRVWTLRPNDSGGYTGTAGDVVGEAFLETAGNALFLDYVLNIPYQEDEINVRVDDRMYLINDRTLINESILTKFGFEVGYVTLVISKS